MKFCKYVLNVKQCTPNCMIYGELGRTPLYLTIRKRLISYWCSLVSSENRKLSICMYKLLYELHTNDVYNDKWLCFVKNELYSNGFNNVWDYQFITSCKEFPILYEQRLKDTFIQKWYSDVQNSSKCNVYKEFKEFEFEDYLVKLPHFIVGYITKLRLSCSKLPIETGRYHNIDREFRFCNLYNQDIIGDEYHLIFECRNNSIVNLREKYLPVYYTNNAFRYKLIILLKNVKYRKIGVALGKFLKETQMF